MHVTRKRVYSLVCLIRCPPALHSPASHPTIKPLWPPPPLSQASVVTLRPCDPRPVPMRKTISRSLGFMSRSLRSTLITQKSLATYDVTPEESTRQLRQRAFDEFDVECRRLYFSALDSRISSCADSCLRSYVLLT